MRETRDRMESFVEVEKLEKPIWKVEESYITETQDF
jgi:hypothetical protein